MLLYLLRCFRGERSKVHKLAIQNKNDAFMIARILQRNGYCVDIVETLDI